MKRAFLHIVTTSLLLFHLPVSAALRVFACEPEWGRWRLNWVVRR